MSDLSETLRQSLVKALQDVQEALKEATLIEARHVARCVDWETIYEIVPRRRGRQTKEQEEIRKAVRYLAGEKNAHIDKVFEKDYAEMEKKARRERIRQSLTQTRNETALNEYMKDLNLKGLK